MKKMFKRTAAIAVSAFMAVQYIPFTTVAATDSSHCDLTIHPYRLTEAQYSALNDTDNAPSGNTAPDATQAANTGGTAITGMNFVVTKVDINGVAITGAGEYSQTVEAGTTLASVPDGYYKIDPQDTKTNTSGTTDPKFDGADAFYIYLPAASVRDVHIYPKLTDNSDTGDDSDPDNPNDNPHDPDNGDKHSIKLTKTLVGGTETPPAWQPDENEANPFYAEFDAYFKNGLGNWEKANTTGSYRTNDAGVVIIDGLPLGEYALVETTAPEGYLLDQTPVMFNLTGTDAATQTGELVNDKTLTVEKVIDTEQGGGDAYNWTITADVPSKPENLVNYKITDTYQNIKLKATPVTSVTCGNTSLTLDTDYEVNTTGGNLVITLTQVGLGKLTASTPIVVNVASELADGYTTGKAKNSARITYQYAYNPDDDNPQPDIPGLPDPNDDNPDPTQDPDPINYPPTGDNPISDEFTPATITISNKDNKTKAIELTGTFNITNCSDHADDDDNDDGDKNDDLLTLANLAPGKYTIKQTGTQSGYTIDTEAKVIFIDKNGDAYEYNATAEDHKGNPYTGNVITFYNDETGAFNLPFTGTTATIVFTITGILLMAGTGFLIFILIKKRDDDDEDEEQVNN